jgi:transcriptional regulator with XRE-family HTH domain
VKHWTHGSTADFAYNLSLDFFTQLQDRLERSPLEQKELARRLGVTPGRISQIFNDPQENPKIESLVKYARSLGMKVSIVAYDDGDPDNYKGPIFSGVFNECWRRANCPHDMSALGSLVTSREEIQLLRTGTDQSSLTRLIDLGLKKPSQQAFKATGKINSQPVTDEEDLKLEEQAAHV